MPLPSHHSNVWAGGSLLMPRTMLRGDGTYSRARFSSSATGSSSRRSPGSQNSALSSDANTSRRPSTSTSPSSTCRLRAASCEASASSRRPTRSSGGWVLVGGGGVGLAWQPGVEKQRVELGRDPQPPAVDESLALEYVPSPRSIVRGISKLPPAHTFEWWLGSGIHRLHRYWSPTLGEEGPASRRPRLEERCEELRAVLRESVRKELISDVPLGA